MDPKKVVYARLGFALLAVGARVSVSGEPSFRAPEREVKVDGKLDDWDGVEAQSVKGRDSLFRSISMPMEKWRDDRDLSFTWRAAWKGNKLYFLLEVTDDKVLEPTHELSFKNDCIEIFLDHRHQKGLRIGADREVRGYEIHFLSFKSARVYLNDFKLAEPANEAFSRDWAGEVVLERTDVGYLAEIAFTVPETPLKAGQTMGIELAVCDDDGSGRESQLLWTGKQVKYWRSMDDYGELVLAPGVRSQEK